MNPAPPSRAPNFENLRRTLLRLSQPDYVPMVEFSVDADVKAAFLGHPIRDLRDEVEFWVRAGYDFVPVQAGIRSIVRPGHSAGEKPVAGDVSSALMRHTQTAYSVYESASRNMAWAEEKRGAISSMEDFERFPWPDPDQMDLSRFDEIRQHLPPGMKVIAFLGWIFTSVWTLMGLETFCFALYEQPELIRRMYDRVWAIQSRILLRLLKSPAIGAIAHPDDLAYSDALMIAPAHFRQCVFPFYRWSCTMVREHGLPNIFHSDGRLDSVLEDILACGFDALHPIEPKAMDIADCKKKIGHRVCLIGNIDLGYTLTRGTPREVEEEVKERIRTIGPGGGYCVGSSNSITSYVPLENFNALRAAAIEYGRYPL
jgi:uroporphyrinogen decarboxylase